MPLRGLQETAWYQVENSEEEGYEHAFASKFELAASPRHMSMRLCVTEQGTIGMVPQRARKGDSVCVLIGCSVPVVLRRQEGGLYEFVGGLTWVDDLLVFVHFGGWCGSAR